MKFEAVNNRVIALVDMEQKNYFTFSNGVTIRHERNWDNFDQKHTQQVLGTVLSADNIPEGALVLFHHNGTHPTNEMFDHASLSGEDIAKGIKVFSIPENEVFLWKIDGNEWMPTKGFVIADRVFEPYKGVIQNIPPKKLKNTLYIKTGELKGYVVRTLVSCDYEIIFRAESGREERIVRCRHFEDEDNEREEIVAIDHGATEKVLKGEFLLGLSESDAKPIKDLNYAR